MNNHGKILVADDDETFLYSTADLLRTKGYQCDCAMDSDQALQLLQNKEIDLLISDINMPGNPELEFIKTVTLKVEGLPIIIVTGYPSLQSAVESVELPVSAYLLKPVKFDKLLKHVRSLIKKYHSYACIRNIKNGLQSWLQELESVENSLAHGAENISVLSNDKLIDLMYKNVIDNLLDLKYLTNSTISQNGDEHVCHLLNCPRLKVLSNAIEESIDVLQKTKHSFKSKELGILRHKLEKVMEEVHS